MSKFCEIVWDGKNLNIPKEMGTPQSHHFLSTNLDNLIELCGRICYDSISLKKSRSSPDYHKHIAEVGHLSVQEHANFTVLIPKPNNPEEDILLLKSFLNRPGIYLRETEEGYRLTLNIRCASDWNRHNKVNNSAISEWLGNQLRSTANELCPLALSNVSQVDKTVKLVEPETDEEVWVSFHIRKISRSNSHELVRHKFGTGVSQRCLAAGTKIKFRKMWKGKPNAIVWRNIEDLYKMKSDPRIKNNLSRMNVQILDEMTSCFTTSKVVDVVSNGEKDCYEITLHDGKSIKCTSDHKFFTENGWMALRDIADIDEDKIGGVVVWNKNKYIKIATNGLSVAGNGLYRDQQWLELKYYTEKKNLSEIAEESECSIHVIRKWLKRFGLQKKMSEINLGRVPWNKGISYNTNKKYSEESIKKYSESKMGDKNPSWKGGLSKPARRDFELWKKNNGKSILERDGYCCKMCGKSCSQIEKCKNNKRTLEIAHIIPLWFDPSKSCDPNNMITLCWRCHSSLNNKELEVAPFLSNLLGVDIPEQPEIKRSSFKKSIIPKWSHIVKIQHVGKMETYDLVLDGPNHGFVANGIVVHNSTRYVDEHDSEWAWHPLIELWESNGGDSSALKNSEIIAKEAYGSSLVKLEEFIKSRGVDKFTARKQARGAARGVLGNALSTELIFSASLSQWKWMLRLRASDAADAEIRVLFVEVFNYLKEKFPERFSGWGLAPSSDGMGEIVTEI